MKINYSIETEPFKSGRGGQFIVQRSSGTAHGYGLHSESNVILSGEDIFSENEFSSGNAAAGTYNVGFEFIEEESLF